MSKYYSLMDDIELTLEMLQCKHSPLKCTQEQLVEAFNRASQECPTITHMGNESLI